jgi:ribonuclease P protein component
MPAFQTIKARPDFLAVRGGQKASTPGFLLEAKPRRPGNPAGPEPRFGFTVTKKLGNAVRRNRIRRRLKAAVAEAAADLGVTGFDYVIVARAAAFDRRYGDLVADVTSALRRVHKPAGQIGRKDAPLPAGQPAKKPAT